MKLDGMTLGLLSLAFLGGEPAGGRYIPAHMQDGQLIPGRIEAAPK